MYNQFRTPERPGRSVSTTAKPLVDYSELIEYVATKFEPLVDMYSSFTEDDIDVEATTYSISEQFISIFESFKSQAIDIAYLERLFQRWDLSLYGSFKIDAGLQAGLKLSWLRALRLFTPMFSKTYRKIAEWLVESLIRVEKAAGWFGETYAGELMKKILGNVLNVGHVDLVSFELLSGEISVKLEDGEPIANSHLRWIFKDSRVIYEWASGSLFALEVRQTTTLKNGVPSTMNTKKIGPVTIEAVGPIDSLSELLNPLKGYWTAIEVEFIPIGLLLSGVELNGTIAIKLSSRY